MSNLKAINKAISSLRTSEKNVIKQMSFISRESLAHVVEFWDVSVCNNVLSALSLNNRRTAVLFYKAFTPFTFNEVTNEFESIGDDKKAKKARSEAAIRAFLDDQSNDFWTWAQSNVIISDKPVDFLGKVTRATKTAVDKGHVKTDEIIKAILAAGVSEAELKAAVAALTIK